MLIHKYPALAGDTQPETALWMTPGMWRSVLTRPLLVPGSAVLVAGRRPLEVVDLLVDLAYEVHGLCEEPDAVFAGRHSCPRADFDLWQPQSKGCRLTGKFDVAIAVAQSTHDGNLYDAMSRLATAQLLAALRPGGRLITLAPHGDRCHAPECWQRHLACFPGEISSATITDPWSRWWPFGAGDSTPRPVLAVTLQIPRGAISHADWESCAFDGLWTGNRSCCELPAAMLRGQDPQPLRRLA